MCQYLFAVVRVVTILIQFVLFCCCIVNGEEQNISHMSSLPLSADVLSGCLNVKNNSTNRIYLSPDNYASILVGFPDQVSCIINRCVPYICHLHFYDDHYIILIYIYKTVSLYPLQ